MENEFTKAGMKAATEGVAEAINALAKETDEKAKESEAERRSFDPGSHFWYALLGAYINKTAEQTEGIPITRIGLEDIKAIAGRIVKVIDDPQDPTGFIITVEKQ